MRDLLSYVVGDDGAEIRDSEIGDPDCQPDMCRPRIPQNGLPSTQTLATLQAIKDPNEPNMGAERESVNRVYVPQNCIESRPGFIT